MQMPVKQKIGIGTIEVDKLRLDGGTQPREQIDDATAYEYGAAMRDQGVGTFEPVIVYYDGSDYWLADGFHRVTGAKQFGVKNISADIRQGTRRDAVLFSVGANAKHGLRRTNTDKRRAVELLLRDEEWAKWSDREISRRCGVSDPFVGGIRAELSANDSQIERQVSRGGVAYTINTANIGGKPKSTVTPHVDEFQFPMPGYRPAWCEVCKKLHRHWRCSFLSGASKPISYRCEVCQTVESYVKYWDPAEINPDYRYRLHHDGRIVVPGYPDRESALGQYKYMLNYEIVPGARLLSDHKYWEGSLVSLDLAPEPSGEYKATNPPAQPESPAEAADDDTEVDDPSVDTTLNLFEGLGAAASYEIDVYSMPQLQPPAQPTPPPDPAPGSEFEVAVELRRAALINIKGMVNELSAEIDQLEEFSGLSDHVGVSSALNRMLSDLIRTLDNVIGRWQS